MISFFTSFFVNSSKMDSLIEGLKKTSLGDATHNVIWIDTPEDVSKQ